MRRITRSAGRKRLQPVGVVAQARRIRREHLVLHVKRIAAALLLIVLVAAASVAGWPWLLAHLQATAVLKLVSQQTVPWIVGEAVAEPIATEEVHFESPAGTVHARLYVPVNKPQAPAMVIFHGIHHLGMDEPRLESFAAAIASCGVQVLTPELPNIKDYRVDASSIRVIGESTRWFSTKTGGPIGVMGLSFSGGLALLAAADPLYKPAIKFVFAVGAQDAMAHIAQYYLTGTEARPDGTIESLLPHEYGALVLEYEHLDEFVPAADVEPLRVVLRQHLYEDKPAETAAIALLTPAQTVEAKLLMDSNAPATRQLLAKANTRHISDMAGLSPAGKLRTMTTPVYLLHGQADNIIPAAETLWMADELPELSRKAVLVSPVLSHLDLDAADPGLLDQWRLIHFMALVMHATETPERRLS